MKELTTYNRTAGYLNKVFKAINTEYYNNELEMPTITIQSTVDAIQTGWVKYGNKYCYLDPSTGARQTGWVKYDGKYYYFHPTTGFLKTGWLKYGGNYYYLSPKTGTPVTGKQKIGGKTYTFNAKGICVG